MRVTFNSFRDDSQAYISREAGKQAQIQAQISSGQKISRTDQDPQTASRVLGLQTSGAQDQQYYKNASYALDVSQTSYTAIDELRKVSDRVGEITSSISGVSTSDAYDAYALEVNQMLEHAVSSVGQKFDGQYVLGGTKTDAAPFTAARDASGQVTGVSYVGAASGASIQISDTASVSPFPDGTTNSQLSDFMNNLVALRDALKSHSSTAVDGLRAPLQDSEDSVLATLGGIGAQQSRLEMTQSGVSAHYDETVNRLSTANDVDLSQAVIDLTKSQTAYQAAIQSTAKIMSHSLLDYL